MQKLALFGGSFNPIHWGHLLMAETALNQLELSHVIWIPTYAPPYKTATQLLAFHHRWEMLQRAIASHSNFIACAVEASRSGVSYAADTFRDLQVLYPESQWYWLIGADAFQSLPRWYRRQEFVEQCCWVIAPRCGAWERGRVEEWEGTRFLVNSRSATEALCEQVARTLASESLAIKWQILPGPGVEISSSLIRQYCRDRRSIRYLVLDAVREYILEHGLYELPQ